MHLKVFVKLKKTLKTLSSGQKNAKKPKKTHRAGFFKKTRVFSNPGQKGTGSRIRIRNTGYWEITQY
jgi:hypothetical protein